MKWSKTLPPARPLRGVAIAPPPVPVDVTALAREHEEQGYARGLIDGEQRLGAQLLQQRSELRDLQNGVLASLRQAVTQVTRDAENAVLEVAFEVARKIVAEVPIDRNLVETNVRGALAGVEDATEFFIQLHPDDLALLQQHTSDLLESDPNGRQMHFLPSPDVARGGCLVRTKFGIIDARRETRLTRMRETLMA